MNQLTQWNPFRSLSKIDPSTGFEDFVRHSGLRSLWRDLDVIPQIRVDVREDDKAYNIKADIPGMKKEDINVSIEGRQVEIRAESSHKIEKNDGSCLCTERSEGMVSRSFTLPTDVDSSTAAASYADGVLTMTLPKKPNGNSQRIKVN